MKKKEIIFIVTFVICLAVLSFFLGSSITGYVVRSAGSTNPMLEEVPSTLDHILMYSIITGLVVAVGVIHFNKK